MTKDLKNQGYLYVANLAYLESLAGRKDFNADQELVSLINSSIDEIKLRPASSFAVIASEHSERGHPENSTNKVKREALDTQEALQSSNNNVLENFRRWGHLAANIDPLGFLKPQIPDMLNVSGDLADKLKNIYCNKIGYEISHIEDLKEQEYLYNLIENSNDSIERPKDILNSLIKTAGFESFLQVKFPSAKRFGIEGGEAILPAVQEVVKYAESNSFDHLFLGMAHRGRLNILCQVFDYPYAKLYASFKGFKTDPLISGDVKYHKGNSTKLNNLSLTILFNPSHLEFVNPLVGGAVRAKIDEGKKALGILIHGDAAFAGQGVVTESIQMSKIPSYDTQGIIHFIINNQIGFTADPHESRSTRYCTDWAKAMNAPIMHVNGDDVEAVIKATRIAIKYKQEFGKDVFIDIVCYRLNGHNEMDEPSYTQPVMYKEVKAHKRIAEIYKDHLISKGIITKEEAESYANNYEQILQEAFVKSDDYANDAPSPVPTDPFNNVMTGVDLAKLKELGVKINSYSKDFSPHPRLGKQIDGRREAIEKDESLEWGIAENLAYATLLSEGYKIRIIGQDSCRGTFSHRHAVLHDIENGKEYVPLKECGSQFSIYNSYLSENAAMGFEYGYSLFNNHNLVIWEAQFGDFANGAQPMFDQFISSGESKWGSLSNMVLLLPHGYEGQGPEHSSARLERFLQLTADYNIGVIYPTTPANIFHALRRQLKMAEPKPLIVMTPKSLLRHKDAVSHLKDMAEGTQFLKIMVDEGVDAKKVVLCSGKIYYDIREKKTDDMVIIRCEQLYPFPSEEVKEVLSRYPQAKVIWSQEEPVNMGAWQHVRNYLELIVDNKIEVVGRKAASSPASGYDKVHKEEQLDIISRLLAL